MTPKSILLLGAGGMGNVAAQTLASFPEVGSLTIADLDSIAAQIVAAACGNKARPAGIDVTDRNELVTLMRRADLIMNCVGPFFRFGVPILEAAIEAETDYLDICDDPEPTKAMHELHDRAKKANITAIVGLGASPGITSILAARAKEELDQTDELIAGWNIEEDDGSQDEMGYSAAIVHWMQQCSGTILECENGRLVEKKPLTEIPLEYPGRGRRTVYTVGHPEPVSFHYSFPDLQRSYCIIVMPSLWIDVFRKFAEQIDRGTMTLEKAGQNFVEHAVASSLMEARFSERPRLPIFFAVAKGIKDGRTATVATTIRSIPPDMARSTGIPLALGARLLLQGKVLSKGVTAPELAFSPAEFLGLLAPYCIFPARVDAAELLEVTRKFD